MKERTYGVKKIMRERRGIAFHDLRNCRAKLIEKSDEARVRKVKRVFRR